MPIYTLPFGNDTVFITDDSPSHKEINVQWTSPAGLVEITLVALWQPSAFFTPTHQDNFQTGDYYQHTIIAQPTGHGLGPQLLNFILDNQAHLGFTINHFYSTRETGDATGLSEPAREMWINLVELEKATFHAELNRYELLWQAQ